VKAFANRRGEQATLLRRATLDLTGLPPTPEVSAAFMADRSNDAYVRAVDRLLGSPHYGERWRPLAGPRALCRHQRPRKDNRRAIWKVRDWVIDALNRDMPFDTFTIEADRRRHASECDRIAEDRQRLPPQRDDERGRWRRSGRVEVRGARRSRQHHGDGVAGDNAGVCAMP
jgi:hypothetical protein